MSTGIGDFNDFNAGLLWTRGAPKSIGFSFILFRMNMELETARATWGVDTLSNMGIIVWCLFHAYYYHIWGNKHPSTNSSFFLSSRGFDHQLAKSRDVSRDLEFHQSGTKQSGRWQVDFKFCLVSQLRSVGRWIMSSPWSLVTKASKNDTWYLFMALNPTWNTKCFRRCMVWSWRNINGLEDQLLFAPFRQT